MKKKKKIFGRISVKHTCVTDHNSERKTYRDIYISLIVILKYSTK